MGRSAADAFEGNTNVLVAASSLGGTNRLCRDRFHVVTNPEELLRTVRAGKAEIVLASSLQGLAHSSLELVQVLREFVSRKIALIVPSAGIDTSKVSRKALNGHLEHLSEIISEKRTGRRLFRDRS